MNTTAHYTDEDFQTYCDGTFNGDPAAFSSHIQSCPACHASLQAYWAVAAFAKDEWATAPLSISLAASVAQKVYSRQRKDARLEKIGYGGLAVLTALTLLLSLGKLMVHVGPGLLMLLAVPVALYVLLSLKEHKIMRPDAFPGNMNGSL